VCESNTVAYSPAFTYPYTDAKWNAESDTESYAKSNTKAATDPASKTVIGVD
jgi:hypothetical protein